MYFQNRCNPNVFYVGGDVTEVHGVEHYDFHEHRITPKQRKDKANKTVAYLL